MKGLFAAPIALALSIAPAAAIVNPGVLTLGDFQISSAGQQSTAPANIPTNLAGLTGLSCSVRFAYGAGGTKTTVYIQSSLDGGNTWFDVANFAFTTSSALEAINLSGLNAVGTPQALTSLGLADNTTLNGPMGDRLQAVVVSTGTYSGSTLVSVRCAAR